MKRIGLVTLFFVLAAIGVFAQNIRVDVPLLTSGPNVPSNGGAYPTALWVPNATVQICQHPATISSCTYVQTYADVTNGNPCPPTQQLVQLPGTTCSSNAGTLGNIGFWYAGGTVDYVILTNQGTFGPYTITGVNGSGNFVSSVTTSPQILMGPLTIPGITPTGFGITDWRDLTSGCHAYRGVVNVLDCGAVADGSYVAGGCSQTPPTGCFKGTDNTAAIRKAIAALTLSNATGSGGGKVVFPVSGTNIWMVGAPNPYGGSDDCVANSQTGMNGIFNLANGVVLEGAGRWTTTLMANPGTASSTNCAMFQNTNNIPLGIAIKGLRMDGNEAIGTSGQDWMHPNNNFSTAVNNLLALNMNGNQQNGPAVILFDFVISGFDGSSTTTPNAFAPVILGGNALEEWTNGYVLYNVNGPVTLMNSDNVFTSIYWYKNGSQNSADGLDIFNGGTSFVSNYFGGGSYGTAQVLIKGASGNRFTNCTFDNTGAAQLRIIDNGGQFSAYNFVADSVFSQPGNNGTPAPDISVEGHSYANKFSNLYINTGPLGHSTYGIQELGSATDNTYEGITFDNTTYAFGTSTYVFQAGSTSEMVGGHGISIGLTNTPYNAMSYQISGNTILPAALTGFHGNSTKVQISDGTGTSGNIAKYDANGNVTDGGIAASALPTVGTGSLNQAVCFVSVGPPAVLGHCTSVVGSGGACTCVP